MSKRVSRNYKPSRVRCARSSVSSASQDVGPPPSRVLRRDHDRVSYIASTERLGWPDRRWWTAILFFVEVQAKLQYDNEPDRPTATRHLQPAEDVAAICGYPWELLVPVPG